MDDSEVIGTVNVDKPAVPSGRDGELHVEIDTGQLFRYPENVEVAKKFLQYKRSLDGKWGNYVMNVGLWFRTLVRPDEAVKDGFLCYLNQVVFGLSIPQTFFQKGVMNVLKSCPGQLNGNVFEMMKVCEALNRRWRDGGIMRQFVADDVLKYYKFKYVKDRKSGYLFSDSARPKFFDFESVGKPWCDHLMMVRGNCIQVPRESALELIHKNCNETEPNPKGAADTSSLFDVVSREGTELNNVLGALGIRREKRLNYIVEKVQRAHHNRAMATSGSAYDDIMEIPACVADIQASSKGVNLKAVEQEALDLAKRDPIRLDTQIRSSISQLSVAWKSAAKMLKVAAADRV
ncbi:hypothetical protein GIB67_042054 [Kingdonia uniflora]|uniref:Uncharacterized protein n=1 Tax=Kingdonia uniflora TaxID=39325 RepID=A0A7J7MVQ5_9MAGN|nr:hypothetical protein GIB67_042054 [Kingdonia uniflora]